MLDELGQCLPLLLIFLCSEAVIWCWRVKRTGVKEKKLPNSQQLACVLFGEVLQNTKHRPFGPVGDQLKGRSFLDRGMSS